MPRGPLPSEQKRRRNAPTIPTTSLPVGGLDAPTPEPPRSANLDTAGVEWWEWAWHTPQAAAWDAGSLYTIARRASLEDDLAAVGRLDSLDADDLTDASSQALRGLVQRLAGLATGRLNICREMREIDDRLGLTPKSLAQLRWKITEDGSGTPSQAPQRVGRAKLKVV